jgi:lactate permease
LAPAEVFRAWLPWLILVAVMAVWSKLHLFNKGQIAIPTPRLENGRLLSTYQNWLRPLDVGTAVLVATALTAICFGARVQLCLNAGVRTFRQVLRPGLTVMSILGLAYIYNYSGMAHTLGLAAARIGPVFPLLSSYLGWAACFLSGSDTASNILFGNLQVHAARQLQLSPILLAGTNSSGGVISKMISPQNIAVGVTTVGLTGQEGNVLRWTFLPSILLAALLGLLAYAQAYWVPWMVP